MPLAYSPGLDDDIISDGSTPLLGVDNSRPPDSIDPTMTADAENRLSLIDNLNRPRPGIIRLAQTPGGAIDSIHHVGNGLFLANNGPNWYTWDNRARVWTTVAGGPSYALGSQVFSTVANNTLYFSTLAPPALLNKYTPGTGFGTVTLPTQYPQAYFPVWMCYRLIYTYQNTLVVSDALNPEYVDVITGTVTLDPIVTDTITGQALWKDQKIAVFRNGSTWLVETGPGLDVPNWTVNRVSATIGCRNHGTIIQAGNDVLFLSETGRGVYALGQAPTSDEEGVWLPISVEIQDYIERINWAACWNARATCWGDLYMLSVPLDKSTYNNFVLIYSLTLKHWQGLWCFDVGTADVGVRDFARDRTDPNYTMLLIATQDGMISRFTYPIDRQYYDLHLDNSRDYFDSYILSRGFNFSMMSRQYAYGADVNQFRPHSARFQFIESEEVVTVTAIADRAAELIKKDLATSAYLLQLTIPAFPFDLDIEGYKIQAIGLLKTGLCAELQFRLEGKGNWTIYQIKASAFASMPKVAR